MEDCPIFELNLSEHLALDLAIDLTSTLLNVKAGRSTGSIGTHQKVTSLVLYALQLLRIFVELEVPGSLLLLAFLVVLEVVHQILDLLDLGFSVGVNDLGQILHQAEISTHCISQTSDLTQFRNKSNFKTSTAVLVDQKRLVRVLDLLVVLGLVVLGVRSLSALLVETGLRRLRKVHAVNLVGLLIVGSHHSCTCQSLLHSFIAVLTTTLSLGTHVIHQLEHRVSADDFEAHVDVEQTALLLHDQS